MTPSDELKAFTKHSEGLVLKAIRDANGFEIGYGHWTPTNQFEGGITEEEAEAFFDNDIMDAAREVEALVSVPLTQGQFDCLTDFVYNLGAGALKSSTLLKALNLGRYAQVPSELYRIDPETGEERGWIFSNGEVNKGLIARRQGEIAFWNGSSNAPSATE